MTENSRSRGLHLRRDCLKLLVMLYESVLAAVSRRSAISGRRGFAVLVRDGGLTYYGDQKGGYG